MISSLFKNNETSVQLRTAVLDFANAANKFSEHPLASMLTREYHSPNNPNL